MPKCPTCGLDADTNLCPDPIHDLADRCVELRADLAEAVGLLEQVRSGVVPSQIRRDAKRFLAKQEGQHRAT